MRVCSWQDKTKCCRCLEKLNNILVHVDFKGFCLIFRTFKHTDCLAYETWLTNWTINSLVFRLLSTERFSLSSGMQRWLFIWWTLCKHVKDRSWTFLSPKDSRTGNLGFNFTHQLTQMRNTCSLTYMHWYVVGFVLLFVYIEFFTPRFLLWEIIWHSFGSCKM